MIHNRGERSKQGWETSTGENGGWGGQNGSSKGKKEGLRVAESGTVAF